MARHGNTLVVSVVERPTIGLVTIEGNKEFPDKQLYPILKQLGVAEGLSFDNSKINGITQGLREQYHQLGYYAAQVNTEVKPQPRNRVAIVIHIKEGPIARIKSIQIIGNKAFEEKRLLKSMTLTPSSWWKLTVITGHDRYSKTQLEKDLELLHNFYYDHGYLRFQVVNQNVKISPDHKSVTIVIYVNEGPIYKLAGFKVNNLSTNNAQDNNAINSLITLKPGQIFSRSQLLNITERIRTYYANKGHAFPTVKAEPKVNDYKHQVFINYTIAPGPITYVRKVSLLGNTRSKDMALRNRILQMEAAPYSLTKVEQSKQRLAYLPYLSDVTVNTVPVPDQPDQVDIEYHVKDVNAGKASLQGGYSTTDGFIYGASLTEPNLMGTGKYGSLAFNASKFQKSYSLSYINPYYTTYGVSRGITIFSNITTATPSQNLSSYTMDGYGGAVTYGIPVSLNNRVNLGYGYTYVALSNLEGHEISPTVLDFVDRYGKHFNQFKVTGSWLYNTLDRAVAPTRGFSHLFGVELGVPVVSSSLSYYKLTEEIKYYYPLGAGFIINPHTSWGFGNGYGNVNTLPFFYNFYAGGIETIPGFAPNSLGPRNPRDPSTALGGNLRVIGGFNLIFPNYISDRIRTALTFTAGNVFQTNQIDKGEGPDQIPYESVSLKNIRTSAGLMVIWYSPLGPLQFSIAKALNPKHNDDERKDDQEELFGFVFGASI